MTESSPSPSIEEAEKAFERGNYAETRRLASKLAASEERDVKAKAEALLERISPAPLGKYLFVLTALLLLSVTIFAYSKP